MSEYCEIVIRYGKKMPPTSLEFMKRDLEQYGSKFAPKIKVKLEKVEVKRVNNILDNYNRQKKLLETTQ